MDVRQMTWRAGFLKRTSFSFALVGALVTASLTTACSAQQPVAKPDEAQIKKLLWMNANLSPDERADMVLKEMTLDEKLDLAQRQGMPGWGPPRPNAHLGNGGAGFVLAIERLGIPFIQMSDAAYGVRSSAANGRDGQSGS